MNQPSVWYGFRDIELQKYWGHDLDLLGSCDVIADITIGLPIYGFLLAASFNKPSVSQDS